MRVQSIANMHVPSCPVRDLQVIGRMFLPNGEIAGLIDTGPAFNGVIVSQFRVTVTKTHHRTDAIIVCDFKPVRMAYSDEG